MMATVKMQKKSPWQWIEQHRWVLRAVMFAVGTLNTYDAYRHSPDSPGLMTLDIVLATACSFVFVHSFFERKPTA
jgi:hypothetical protein